MNAPQPLLLELGMEQCVYCGKDAETCEHFEDARREAQLDAQAEYEDQRRYEREAMDE